MHDDQFTATGPSHHSSGVKTTAFSTESASDFLCGVSVQGARCGVVGVGLQVETDTFEGASSLPGVGVQGTGVHIGTVGKGRRGALAGVFGDGTQCKIGVLGAVMDQRERTGIGIVGASVRQMGNALGTFAVVPEPADGSGIGVLGTSGTGPGVRGRSAEDSGGDFASVNGAGVSAESGTGPGVRGKSTESSGGDFTTTSGVGVSAQSSSGVAIHAVSKGNRGGQFQSGPNIAQIRLVPLQQTGEPKLPVSGSVGDLLLIRNIVDHSWTGGSDKCSLWLCVPHPSGLRSHAAYWQEVQLGALVAGTI